MSRYRNLYNSKYKVFKSRGWSGWGSPDREELGRELFERIVANNLIPRSGVGLELGCGEGQLSRKLSAHGYKMSGVDISDEALSWALEKARNNKEKIHYFRADVAEEGIDLGGPYDFIVDGHCSHCITKHRRSEFYKNVHHALASDGIFFVSTRCSKSQSTLVYDSGLEYRYFGLVEDILAELAHAGFKVLSHLAYDRIDQIHLDVLVSHLTEEES